MKMINSKEIHTVFLGILLNIFALQVHAAAGEAWAAACAASAAIRTTGESWAGGASAAIRAAEARGEARTELFCSSPLGFRQSAFSFTTHPGEAEAAIRAAEARSEIMTRELEALPLTGISGGRERESAKGKILKLLGAMERAGATMNESQRCRVPPIGGIINREYRKWMTLISTLYELEVSIRTRGTGELDSFVGKLEEAICPPTPDLTLGCLDTIKCIAAKLRDEVAGGAGAGRVAASASGGSGASVVAAALAPVDDPVVTPAPPPSNAENPSAP